MTPLHVLVHVLRLQHDHNNYSSTSSLWSKLSLAASKCSESVDWSANTGLESSLDEIGIEIRSHYSFSPLKRLNSYSPGGRTDSSPVLDSPTKNAFQRSPSHSSSFDSNLQQKFWRSKSRSGEFQTPTKSPVGSIRRLPSSGSKRRMLSAMKHSYSFRNVVSREPTVSMFNWAGMRYNVNEIQKLIEILTGVELLGSLDSRYNDIVQSIHNQSEISALQSQLLEISKELHLFAFSSNEKDSDLPVLKISPIGSKYIDITSQNTHITMAEHPVLLVHFQSPNDSSNNSVTDIQSGCLVSDIYSAIRNKSSNVAIVSEVLRRRKMRWETTFSDMESKYSDNTDGLQDVYSFDGYNSDYLRREEFVKNKVKQILRSDATWSLGGPRFIRKLG